MKNIDEKMRKPKILEDFEKTMKIVNQYPIKKLEVVKRNYDYHSTR